MQEQNDALDPSDLYTRAAGKIVKHTLAGDHGTEFAEYFIDEHADAIRRAVRKRLCGRTEAAILDAAGALAANASDA